MLIVKWVECKNKCITVIFNVAEFVECAIVEFLQKKCIWLRNQTKFHQIGFNRNLKTLYEI